MTYVEQVAESTYWLEGRASGLTAIFAVYFIKEAGGVIIEPGPASVVPQIEKALQELGLSSPSYIIPTHIHLDHGGGSGRLAQLFPEAKVVVSPPAARHVVDPSRLIQGTREAFGEDFEKFYGPILPVPESQVKVVNDEERLRIGSRELIFIRTPGHAPHHMSIFDTKTKGLFCGEALGLIYGKNAPPLPAVAPPNLDLEAYLSDMERLRKLRPEILFYSHGGVGLDADRQIDSVIENTREVAEAILKAARDGKTDDEVIQYTGEYIHRHFGAGLDAYDLSTNVNGFLHYFRKKGLLPSPS